MRRKGGFPIGAKKAESKRVWDPRENYSFKTFNVTFCFKVLSLSDKSGKIEIITLILKIQIALCTSIDFTHRRFSILEPGYKILIKTRIRSRWPFFGIHLNSGTGISNFRTELVEQKISEPELTKTCSRE